MLPKTPQWPYGAFVLLDTVPVFACAILLGCVAVFWLLARCFCRKSSTDSRNPCHAQLSWMYKAMAKPVVMKIFGDVLKKKGYNPDDVTASGQGQDPKAMTIGDVAVRNDRKHAAIDSLFLLFCMTFLFAVTVFWNKFLFNITEDLDCIPGQACFLASSNLSYSSRPVQCDPSSKQANYNVSANATMQTFYCYKLVLDYALAGGVSSGVFFLTIIVIRATFWVFIRMWKKSRYVAVIVRFIMAVVILTAILLVVLLVPGIGDAVFRGTTSGQVQFYAGYVVLVFAVLFPFPLFLKTGDPERDTEDIRLLPKSSDSSDDDE